MNSIRTAARKYAHAIARRHRSRVAFAWAPCFVAIITLTLLQCSVAADLRRIYVPKTPQSPGVDEWGAPVDVHDLDACLVLIRTVDGNAILRSGSSWFSFPASELIPVRDAIPKYERAWTQDPNTPGWHRLYALAAAETGDRMRALRALENIPASKSQLSAAYRLAAKLHMTEGDSAAALSACSRAIQLNPDASRLYELRRKLRLVLGDADGAMSDLQAACRLGSAISDPLMKQAADRFLKGLSTIDELLAARRERQIQASFDERASDLFQAIALKQIGRHVEAEERLTRYLTVDPHHQLALLLLSSIRGRSMNDPQGALAASLRAIAVGWSPADGFFASSLNLGGSLAEIRGFPWMIATAALLQAAVLELEMGEYQDAIAHAEAAVRIEPRLPLALAVAGWCRWVTSIDSSFQGNEKTTIEGYLIRANDESSWSDPGLIDLAASWFVTQSDVQGLEKIRTRLLHSFPQGSEIRTRVDRITSELKAPATPDAVEKPSP